MFLRRAERASASLEDGTRTGADDDVVAADPVDVGNRGDEIARIVRRISSSDARRDRVSERVHCLSSGAARVLVGADPDEAVVIGRLYRTRLETDGGHGFPPAADDERRGQQTGAADSQVPEEMATGQ